MYRTKRIKRLHGTSDQASNVPKPVVLSQKPSEDRQEEQQDPEKENEVIASSQDILPSSQNNTQLTQSRFLSQRHTISQANLEHQIRGRNFFEITLITCKVKISDYGCEFMNEGDDPISFTRKFRSILSSSHHDNAKKFLDGFKKTFSLKEDSIKTAQKFLSGLIMKEARQTHQSHTSLIQCFFAVSSLKNEIVKCLLDNLQTYVIERAENADRFIVGLVVAQFKFSDQLLETETYNLMYERLFKILEKTKTFGCREVIISNFRDLDEFKQDDAVKRLMLMYENDYELLTPFIETFTEMCINEETKTKISSLVNYLLENNCDPKLYPGVVKYLLCYVQQPQDIVNHIRMHLKWENDSPNDLRDIKLKVVQLLEKSVRQQTSKIAETWIKVLTDLNSSTDLKLLDFIMMLVITSVKEDKIAAIKKILVQKLPAGFFNQSFISEVFKKFPEIISQYSETLLELLNSVQKNKVYEINEFSSSCFKELFGIESSDKKEIVGSLVQFLCEKTPQLAFAPKSDFKMMTLNILGELIKSPSSAEALLLNHKILLRVLDISKVKLTYNENRLMMELLCVLGYTLSFRSNHSKMEALKLEEEQSVLSEHLEMMTNKLMYNPDKNIKQLGIIGAIKIVSAVVVNIHLSSENLDPENVTIDDIPAGPIRNAAKRIEFIFEAVRNSPNGFAMVCDELSLEFRLKPDKSMINEIFLVWLSEKMFKQLNDIVGVPIGSSLPELEDVKLENNFQVPSEFFSQPDYTAKLGLLVFEEKSEDIVAIPSLFKLTRLLVQYRPKGLAEMYIFSVMPIIVTENFATMEDELSDSNEALSKQKLDLYFHCANWLRELIGTYCHWNKEDREALIPCVLKRLKQLVQVEKRLSQLLTQVPMSYYPPAASFLDLDATKRAFDSFRKEKKFIYKPPKKIRKKNNTAAVNTSTHSQEEILETSNKIRPFCREIDTQVVLLLMMDFKFKSDVGESELGLSELVFVLDDTYNKIQSICNARSADSRGFYSPIQAIRDLKNTVLHYLVKIFYEICDEFASLSQTANEQESIGIFYTKDANLLKICFSLILQFFEVVLSTHQLKFEKNKTLLLETLNTMLPIEMQPTENEDLDVLCSIIITHCASFEVNVKNCEGAVALVKFLETISKFSSRVEQHDVVIQLCENFLKKQWKNSTGQNEHGAVFNANLETLLQIYISEANFDKLEGFVAEMSSDFKLIKSKECGHRNQFPSFSKANSFHMLRTYLARLSQIVILADPRKLDYGFWLRCSKIFQQFKEVVKCVPTPNACIVFLKSVIIFQRVFYSCGIPILKQNVKNKNKFTELIASFQAVHRSAHGVACELKHRKNKSVFKLMPKFHEHWVKNFQAMRALLPLAGIPIEAIHIGPLVNYDMNEEAILSQNTIVGSNDSDEQEEDEEDENLMEVEDDETIGNLNVTDADENEAHHQSFRSRSTIL